MTDTHLSEASNSNSSILNKPMLRRTYKDAVNALNSLQSNFATIDAVRKSGINRSPVLIPEMIEWARRIGYKPSDLDKLNIVHVTGTKGKGSTCAFVNSILSQFRSPTTFVRSGVSPVIADPEATSPISTTTTASSAPPPSTLGTSRITKIGLYTSPHLKSVRERIMINGKPVSEELFARYFFEVWDRLDKSTSDTTVFPHMGPGVKPAYFRYLTLLSFHTFIREGVDSAVFEVGIGGEYDSTNIIEHPTACGIATLGLDHTQVLGNTLESIAWNKSGIFKPGSACFSVRQNDEAATKMIEERAKEKQVGSFEWVDVRPDVQELRLGINGDFQVQNASLAVALCYAHLQKLGFNIDTDTLPDQFINGLEQARWPGRCQVLPDKLRNDLIWYIDGAHTKESVEGSTHWFTTVTNPERSRVLLFNQQTRDPERLLNVLHNEMEKGKLRFDHVVFTTNVTWSSGDYSEDLVSLNTSSQQVDSLQVQTLSAEIWNKLDKKSRKHIFHDIETGVNFIRSLEGPLDVFVCGSLHLVGGFLVVLESKEGKMVNGL